MVWVANPELRAMETPLEAAERTNDGISALLVVVCDAWCNGWRARFWGQREMQLEFQIGFGLGVGGFGAVRNGFKEWVFLRFEDFHDFYRP